MARKLEPWDGVKVQDIELQWDRASDGAEMARAYALLVEAPALQWDRASDGAEIIQRTDTAVQALLLQWDRASDGAEMAPTDPPAASHCEASMGPRQ